MIHLLEHTMEDIWVMIPLLYLAYLVIEYFERRESNDDKLFFQLQKYGPLVGSLVGIVPQCGFSIIAAMLYMNRNITLGTLLSVFIATSDEAIPILLANPSVYSSIFGILALKVIVGIVVGYVVDKHSIHYYPLQQQH